MDAHTYIKQRQIAWAFRRQLDLIGSKGDLGEKAYVTQRDHNLYQPLSRAAHEEYRNGDGKELGNGKTPGKMQAVHSSAAIAVNVFDYLRTAGQLKMAGRILRIPASAIESVTFEEKLPVAESSNGRKRYTRDPNLDVVIRYRQGSRYQLAGVECKFTEAYCGRGHQGIAEKYLKDAPLWAGIPACRQLAEEIGDIDTMFPHLHAAQLIKHILGLKHAAGGPDRFILVYLWYDVPFDRGAAHRQEIERFAAVVKRDGIDFRPITYQRVIADLVRLQRDEHQPWVDYLAARYL